MIASRYELRTPLGRGGGGTTFVAHDRLHEEDVVVKLVADGDAALRDALRAEMRSLAGLEHRGLARARDIGTTKARDGTLDYLVTDLVRGTTLGAHARDRAFDQWIDPLCDALEGLHYLHRLGLLHGDLKPDNVVVATEPERGVLIDLGCARPMGVALPAVSGTPGFVAPELLAGAGADARADLFALGRTMERLAATGSGSLPPAVRELVRALSADDPADRPTDVAEVLQALGRSAELVLPPAGKASRAFGRERETQVGIAAIAGMCTGDAGPRVVWLSGPDGIGKTRLLTELKWEAQLRARVVEGRAVRPDAIVQLLGAAVGRSIGGELDDVLDARASLAASHDVTVLVLDDAERLDERQARWVASCVRLASRDDRLLWLLASKGPCVPTSPDVLCALALGSLDEDAIARWVGGALSPRRVSELHRASEGVPAQVERMLAALADRPESEVLRAREERGSIESELGRASGRERAALAAVALADAMDLATSQAPAAAELRTVLACESTTLARLLQRGWIRRDEGTYRLHGLTFEEVMTQACDVVDEHVVRLERALARASSDSSDAAIETAIVKALALSGRRERALARWRAARERVHRAPGAWLGTLEALGDLEGEDGLMAAEIELASGAAHAALRRLARLVRRGPPGALRSRARTLGAAAYLRLGRPARALRAIERAEADPTDDDARSRLVVERADLRSRALLALARYRDAERVASAAMEHANDDATSATLRESAGVAATYLGDHAKAKEELAAASAAWSRARDPRARVRVLSYQAIAASREGDLALAATKHREALSVAEAEGLDDQLASVLLNVGTAVQQLGDWGDAIAAYVRGLRLARAVGKKSTEALLGFNLANVYAAVGVVDRADRTLAAVEHALGGGVPAAGTGIAASAMPALSAAALALRAEIASHRGHVDDARRSIERARAAFEALDARRESVERLLDRIALELGIEGSSYEVARALTEAAGLVVSLGASDLIARQRLLEGRAARKRGDVGGAIAALDRAHALAEGRATPSMVAEIEGELAAAWEAAGDAELAAGHRARARGRWSRIALGLPVEMRDAFWAHPLRSELHTRPRVALEQERVVRASGSTGAPAERPAGTSLLRLLEINRRLASSLVVADVLAHALDAAIELTGAERGFLLLQKEGDAGARGDRALEVAVARNLDRERIGRSHLKFSHGIAESVVRRGEPIVTTDARSDERFRGHASVHAMRLSSVACVPIRAPEGVLGAIYLDNRFERGRFAAADLETLSAFADQVAIALRNARLHAALEARTRELEAEKKRVEELARAQAKELERLHEERRAKDEPSTIRHDYREIVGRSASMRRLLATLDRVVDSPLPVLITGESGTGKELVARAIHTYGTRRERPLLSVNCAALPESLLESELFGYTRGAFTGADRDRPGLFVAARGGTLFLDEIGETSLAMQAKLLRVLQEREVRPLGASRSVRVDFRLVAATNRRLRDEVAQGRFREDLYYRIAVVEIAVPALRDRIDDLPVLVRALLDRIARDAGRPPPLVSPDALRLLARHPWPGNVRELENVLGRALTMTDAPEIAPGDLDLSPTTPASSSSAGFTRTAHERDEAERIRAALRDTGFRVSDVARRLGIPRNTLYRRMRRYGIPLRD
ncbi:MAG: sigma 54-interacting transcriptional regulator [Deltaproteobacteria bacterium]|nr:sigma 54-interacting transcriptional regulator [Deltaproteobacteria bacterium]